MVESVATNEIMSKGRERQGKGGKGEGKGGDWAIGWSKRICTARLDIGKRFKRTNITQTVPNVSSYVP